MARVLLLLQALIWCGGPAIEAMSASDALRVASHIEAEGGAACPPIHSHSDCQICRTFSSGALTANGTSLLPAVTHAGGVDCAPVASAHDDGRFGPLGSRAPPRLDGRSGPIT